MQGDPELGVSYQMMELRDGVPTARELRLDRTTLRTLCPEVYKNRQEEKEMREWNNN